MPKPVPRFSDFLASRDGDKGTNPQSDKTVKTSYYLPPTLARALKARAAHEGRFVSDLAREAIERYLQDRT